MPTAARHRSKHSARAAGWKPAAFSGPLAETANFYLLLALLAACALGGGSSFADVYSLLYVRPVALVCLVAGLLVPGAAPWRTFRMPLVLLGLLALLIALQLVPLPPAVWTALPGRAPYVSAAGLAGFAQSWRPLSVTPDLTMNSLVSLVVPAAALVNVAKLRGDQRRALVPALVALCCLSAMLGIAQIAGGENSIFYLYRRTYEGFTVGFLANRNHHAALLALVYPALRVWMQMPAPDRAWERRRQWLAVALGVLILPVILATGSRTGIALALLSIGASVVLFPGTERGNRGGDRRVPAAPSWRRPQALVRIGIPLLLAGLAALTYFSGRAASVERLIALSDVEADQRFRYAPIVMRIIEQGFPLGMGFGSFDPVFRQYEPDAILKSSYFNHAHNEALELAFMAGLPGLLLLAAFLIWWGSRMFTMLRAGDGVDTARRISRLGGVAIAMILLASLVDYPLRAPLVALVFAIGCCWLCEYRLEKGVVALKER